MAFGRRLISSITRHCSTNIEKYAGFKTSTCWEMIGWRNSGEVGNSILSAACGWSIAPPLSIEPLHGPVQNQAYPGVHQKTEINPEGLMASGWRQMWHQNKEVEQVAGDNGDRLFEESAEHAIVVTPARGNSMPEKAGRSSPFAYSLFARDQWEGPIRLAYIDRTPPQKVKVGKTRVESEEQRV